MIQIISVPYAYDDGLSGESRALEHECVREAMSSPERVVLLFQNAAVHYELGPNADPKNRTREVRYAP